MDASLAPLKRTAKKWGGQGRDGEDSLCILLFCSDDRGLHEWFMKENAHRTSNPCLRLLKVVEDFKGSDRYRTISNDELEWMSSAKGTKIHVCLSYLEKLRIFEAVV